MKKIILIFLILVSLSLFSQNKGHLKGKHVEKCSLLDNNTKFISFGKFEIIMWDLNSKSIVWGKKYKELGMEETYYTFAFDLNADKSLLSLMGVNHDNYIIDLKENKSTKWIYDQIGFAANDNIPVTTNTDEFQKYDAWLVNARTNDKIKIGSKNSFHLEISNNGNLVTMKAVDGKKEYYQISTNTFSKKPIGAKTNQEEYDYQSWAKSGSKENYYYAKHNKFGYYNPNKVNNEFQIKFATGNTSNLSRLLKLEEKEKKVFYLENYSKPQEKGDGFDHFSTLTAYNIDTGELLYSLDIIDQSDDNNEYLKAVSAKITAKLDEQNRIDNLPENVLKRRLNGVQGYYYQNLKNKRMYFTVSNSPIYEGNLIQVDELHRDPKLKTTVYEKLENIENDTFYKRTTSHSTCNVCNGKGQLTNNYQSTVADYEYTFGKKIIKNTTITNGCVNCGGCGLVPYNN